MLSLDDVYYVWDKGDMEHFPEAPNFHTREFSCQCTYETCLTQKVSRELIRRLHCVRGEYGFPIVVTSGYRCSRRQADLRASGTETAKGTSQHELGNAADIRPLTLDHMQPLKEAASHHFSSMGVSTRFLHVDTRLSRLSWAYKK